MAKRFTRRRVIVGMVAMLVIGAIGGSVAMRLVKKDDGPKGPAVVTLEFVPADLARVESRALARWLPVSGAVQPVRQATELKTLVEDVLFELKREVHGREIEWRIGELPFVSCDPTLTRQVFANLLANAVKFARDRRPAVIEVGQTLSDGQNILFVRDNGVGFNMKYADRLFGVFQRLHRREDFEGTGIGLATVQRIVHKHGGRIWAEAELDKGATFYFTLESDLPKLEQPNPEPIAVFVGER